MRFFLLVLLALSCAACMRHEYFPMTPATVPADPGNETLGFATSVPKGWFEIDRSATPRERSVTYENAALSGQITVTLGIPGDAITVTLEDAATGMRRAGWRPGKVESIGAQGRYFFAQRDDRHRFVGARTYLPCGTVPTCTVSIDAAWDGDGSKGAHAAIRQVVTSFRLAE